MRGTAEAWGMGEAHHSPTKYVLFLKSDNDTYDNYLQATSVSIRRDEEGFPPRHVCSMLFDARGRGNPSFRVK